MTFTPDIYEAIRAGAQRSAAKLVPIFLETFAPRTVLDVGCGEGWFAEEFARRGCIVTAIDESVDGIRNVAKPGYGEDGFLVYRHADLTGDAWAYELDRVQDDWKDDRPKVGESGFPFDLAVCLEVAEHLPAGVADGLVRTLCEMAPVVVFSAAVPGQGGHGHVNEQWPGYWADRLSACNRLVTGGMRWRFWMDDEIEPWYKQNLLVAATDVAVADIEERATDGDSLARRWADRLFEIRPENDAIPVVHPTTFTYWVEIAKSRSGR